MTGGEVGQVLAVGVLVVVVDTVEDEAERGLDHEIEVLEDVLGVAQEAGTLGGLVHVLAIEKKEKKSELNAKKNETESAEDFLLSKKSA